MRELKRSKLAAAVVGLTAWALSMSAGRAEPHRDPRAVAVADAVEKAVAPDGAWERVGGLRFTFSSVEGGIPQAEFRHTWDRGSGRYRIEGKWSDGHERIIILDVGKHLGDGYMKLKPRETGKGSPNTELVKWFHPRGPLQKKVVEIGYQRFINDTYWLLMPLKMKDPGVNLDYDGKQVIEGETYDIVKMTFERGIGLTPGDTYWVYVNRKTHLVDRWEYILEDHSTGSTRRDGGGKAPANLPKRTTWLWKEWKSFGPLRLSMVKTDPSRKTQIVFKDVEVLSQIPVEAFEPPVKPFGLPANWEREEELSPDLTAPPPKPAGH